MSESRIAADIDDLRARCADTRELYREVCGLLFFRYGITPTANKLYQYVRKGSMNTPAEVLGQFWSDLRERSRVRIDHPALPESLRDMAADLVANLWERAGHEARESLAEERSRARRQAEEALAERDALQARLDQLRRRLDESTVALEQSRAEAADLGRQLGTVQGRLASVGEMVRDGAEEMRSLRLELAAAQRDVARAVGETNALRVQLTLARRRGSRKPLGGIPAEPDPGQEDLGLEPAAPGSSGAVEAG